MDVFEAIRTILAVRKFKDTPVPDDVIGRIVEAARLTSSSRNLQPWHFIVVQNRATLKKIGELATSGPYTADAAFAIVVAYEKESQFGVSDASLAVHSMMLTAWQSSRSATPSPSSARGKSGARRSPRSPTASGSANRSPSTLPDR